MKGYGDGVEYWGCVLNFDGCISCGAYGSVAVGFGRGRGVMRMEWHTLRRISDLWGEISGLAVRHFKLSKNILYGLAVIFWSIFRENILVGAFADLESLLGSLLKNTRGLKNYKICWTANHKLLT